jgi:uncharacterized membrane protein (UPF0136 family)
MLGGGIGGYAAKHSIPSLISGIVSAILLGVGFYLLASKPKAGYGLSLIVALALTAVFIERAVKTSAEPSSMQRNIGLAVLSIVVAAIVGKCMRDSI